MFSRSLTDLKQRSLKSVEKYPQSLRRFVEYGYRITPLPIREGKIYRKWKKFLDESQWWSKSEIEEYQLEKLSKLLNHAYKNVPYYHSLFKREGIKPADIDDYDKLSLIPPLTKKIVKNNLDKLKARNFPELKFKLTATSGSTGVPTVFYHEKGKSKAIEQAFHWRYRNIIGVKYSDEYIFLTGIITNLNRFDANVSWAKYYIPYRILVLSSFHLNDFYLKRYIKLIRSRPNSIFFGFPSNLYALAKYLEKNEETLDNIKLTHTGSENSYSYQRSLMESQFNSQVFDHYGNAEQCALFHQCEQADLYHIIPEYGVSEIINQHGKIAKNMGDTGKLYATSLTNYIFPFIRYDTEDIIEYSGKSCKCGRSFSTIKSIQGRIQEFLVDRTGIKMSLTGIIGALHSTVFKNMEKFQFFQEERGETILKIVKRDGFTHLDKNNILKTLYSKMGKDINIKIEYVDDIKRTSRGKFIWVEQKLSI